DTAFWNGVIETDKDGVAAVEFTMPESLTTWKINVWSMAQGTRVGYGSTQVITRKDLIVRMQMPRFLVEKDQVLLTANVHNYLKSDKNVLVQLETDDLIAFDKNTSSKNIKIAANGEAKIDWLVDAKKAGDAKIRMFVKTDEESDAMEKTLPIYVHGILKQESWSGYIAPDKNSNTIEINVPTERKPEQTKLTLRYSPTLAMSMVEALPYLAEYPYGCTEQTLNRFLPAVIVQKTLIDMNVDLAKLEKAHTNLNAQELGTDRKYAIARKFLLRGKNPVYSVEELRKMVNEGVMKLTQMQCSDGGWGWFGGNGSKSSPHLTALVLHGLLLAKNNDAEVDPNVIERGKQWLVKYQTDEVTKIKNYQLPENERENKEIKQYADTTDAFVLMVIGESASEWLKNNRNDNSLFYRTYPNAASMREFIWRDRGKLSPYGNSILGMFESSSLGNLERAKDCVKILEQYLVNDDENQTAYLNLRRYNGWCWWYWDGSEFETQAYYLKLLMRVDASNSVAPRIVKYLLNNRRHAVYWNSTRDTAICIEAFTEYLKQTGETEPNLVVEILFDGELKKTVTITPENLFEIDNTFVLSGNEVSAGKHKIEFRKRNNDVNDKSKVNNSPLYFNAYLENFTLEDSIKEAGLEVKVSRRLYLLERDDSAKAEVLGSRGQVVDQNVEKYKRTSTDKFKSGDLVEVELIVESKNDYESILVGDWKCAGFEPVEVRSGYNGNELGAYVEFRDERVLFFVYHLPRGKHSVTYRLRAEQPGNFSALPTNIEAMYAPELKANSDENKIKITERKP
ncbi:MAG: alpha-2-macroglobulin, partial [Planctomycetaceae bacterium]|nr:alpha-2-macroglobulin [Planctomycetaceae bacterium]